MRRPSKFVDVWRVHHRLGRRALSPRADPPSCAGRLIHPVLAPLHAATIVRDAHGHLEAIGPMLRVTAHAVGGFPKVLEETARFIRLAGQVAAPLRLCHPRDADDRARAPRTGARIFAGSLSRVRSSALRSYAILDISTVG